MSQGERGEGQLKLHANWGNSICGSPRLSTQFNNIFLHSVQSILLFTKSFTPPYNKLEPATPVVAKDKLPPRLPTTLCDQILSTEIAQSIYWS